MSRLLIIELHKCIGYGNRKKRYRFSEPISVVLKPYTKFGQAQTNQTGVIQSRMKRI